MTQAHPGIAPGRLTVRQWVLLAAGCALAFVLVALDIHFHGLLWRLDRAVADWVLARYGEGVRHAGFGKGLSLAGGFPVVQVAAVALGIIIGIRRWLWGLLYVGTVFATLAGNAALKLLFARPRPDPTILESYSFPSGHSSAATAAYLLAALLLVRVYDRPRDWAVAAVVVASALILLTGAGRVLAGAHYPSDVAAGYLVGATTTCLLMVAWKVTILRQRAKPDHEPVHGE